MRWQVSVLAVGSQIQGGGGLLGSCSRPPPAWALTKHARVGQPHVAIPRRSGRPKSRINPSKPAANINGLERGASAPQNGYLGRPGSHMRIAGQEPHGRTDTSALLLLVEARRFSNKQQATSSPQASAARCCEGLRHAAAFGRPVAWQKVFEDRFGSIQTKRRAQAGKHAVCCTASTLF